MPKKKYTLTFQEVEAPIGKTITKFGGQPVWVTEPQWPLSRLGGTPMQFICQIKLYPELFGQLEAQMAYIFMTEFTGDDVFPNTFDPDAGENAVILQPGAWVGPTLPLTEGPTLYKLIPDETGWPRTQVPCEFAVELHAGEDAEELMSPWPNMSDEELEEQEYDEAWLIKRQTHPTAWDLRYEASVENKIGGIPVPTINYDTFPYPSDDPWQLLLQLQEVEMPFEINFGTDGTGYSLLSKNGRVGKLLWMR